MSLLKFALFLASVHAGQVEEAKCRLEECWQNLFPKITNAVQDGVKLVETYRDGLKAKLEQADKVDARDPSSAQSSLDYKLTVLRAYLEECEDLARGPNEPRYLIVIGHSFADDGANFKSAAATRQRELLQQICGRDPTTDAHKTCAKRIVIKEDLGKADFHAYMRFLGAGSIKKFEYYGHGIENGLVLGPKDLLLPKDWNDTLRISQENWRAKAVGMLYTSDLNGSFAGDLSRVVAKDGSVNLWACETGQGFAVRLKQLVGTPVVQACMVGMQFQYQDSSGDWKSPGNAPIPDSANRTRLIPDKAGAFGEVSPTPKAQAAPAADVSKPASPEDRATRDIVLRVAINSGSDAFLESQNKKVFFSPAERKALRGLMGGRIQRKELKDNAFNARALDKLLTDAMAATADEAMRAQLRVLKEKIQDCAKESVRLYY